MPISRQITLYLPDKCNEEEVSGYPAWNEWTLQLRPTHTCTLC